MALVTMTEMLRNADRDGYAVGAFNSFNYEVTRGIIDAAEKEKAPVIVAFNAIFEALIRMEDYAAMVIAMAKNASVPVALHLDHAVKFETIQRALDCGFTSVMVDASALPLDGNIAETRKVRAAADRYNATLEAELGHVGGLKILQDDDYGECVYTDVAEASRFCRETGVDTLAVAIGTVHGVYKSEPKLNIKRLKELKAALRLPLVLHGASGLNDEKLADCVAGGINKVNIYTDLMIASNAGLDGQPGAQYLDRCCAAASAVEAVARERITVLGGANKA